MSDFPHKHPPAHPCRRKIAQNFSQPAITVVQNQTTNDNKIVSLLLAYIYIYIYNS